MDDEERSQREVDNISTLQRIDRKSAGDVFDAQQLQRQVDRQIYKVQQAHDQYYENALVALQRFWLAAGSPRFFTVRRQRGEGSPIAAPAPS